MKRRRKTIIQHIQLKRECAIGCSKENSDLILTCVLTLGRRGAKFALWGLGEGSPWTTKRPNSFVTSM
jgi:hypothetical protein